MQSSISSIWWDWREKNWDETNGMIHDCEKCFVYVGNPRMLRIFCEETPGIWCLSQAFQQPRLNQLSALYRIVSDPHPPLPEGFSEAMGCVVRVVPDPKKVADAQDLSWNRTWFLEVSSSIKFYVWSLCNLTSLSMLSSFYLRLSPNVSSKKTKVGWNYDINPEYWLAISCHVSSHRSWIDFCCNASRRVRYIDLVQPCYWKIHGSKAIRGDFGRGLFGVFLLAGVLIVLWTPARNIKEQKMQKKWMHI